MIFNSKRIVVSLSQR